MQVRAFLTIFSLLLLTHCQGLSLQHGAELGGDMPGLDEPNSTVIRDGEEAREAPTSEDLRAAIDAQDVAQIHRLINQDVTLDEVHTDLTIHEAAKQGDLESLVIHLTQGVDVNQANDEDWTPLQWAARNGHTATVEALIQHGAEANQADKHGYTPLHLAASYGHTAAVEILIQQGAEVNRSRKSGDASLRAAACSGHTAVAGLLLDYGADVNQANNTGWTPLHWAALNGRVAIVKLFWEHGADARLAITRNYFWYNTNYSPGSMALGMARLAAVNPPSHYSDAQKEGLWAVIELLENLN